MNRRRPLRIQIILDRKTAVLGLATLLVCTVVYRVVSDTLTFTTYYPSPFGVYGRLISTKQTILARDSGAVGLGTTSPGAKLEVAGQVKITGGAPGAGKVLTSDAAGLASWQPVAAGGGPKSVQVFTSPGPAAWTKPNGVAKILVEVYGAGGAGGSGGNAAGGGGAGGVAEKLIDVSGVESVPVAVGAAGVIPGAAFGGAGGSGSSSSFGSYASATGGGGGYVGSSYSAHGGAGGMGSGGDINMQGGAGSPGGYAGQGHGSGGSNKRGGGGQGYGTANVAKPGGLCGGGGGAAYTGANGGGGCVIVWEF